MNRFRCISIGLVVAALAQGAAFAQQEAAQAGDKSAGEEEQIRQREEWFALSRGLKDVERPDLLRAEAVEQLAVQQAQLPKLEAASETWTSLGPTSMTMPSDWGMGRVSGRVAALAVHPTNESVLYVGGGSGGVWKTTNGGASWTPVFDSIGTLTIGALAVSPSDGNVVWVGTGEAVTNCAGYFGMGLYRSTDGGATFQARNGSGSTALQLYYISSIALHPSDSQTLLVSGRGFCRGGTMTAGGVYKSTDGGASWRLVLAGKGSDVVYDPRPAFAHVAYAAMSEGGVYRSVNGGDTWALASAGMATGTSIGRLRLAMAPSAPWILYALNSGSQLYRSADFAGNWTPQNTAACENQCWYNLTLDVHPTNPDELLVGSIRFARSGNGGVTLTPLTSIWGSQQSVHQDTHVLRYSRGNGNRFWVGGDGGLWRTEDGGWSFANLNTNLNLTQLYDVAIHPDDASLVFGGAQDNSSLGRFGSQVWNVTELTGDGFVNLVDPADPDRIFQSSYPWQGLPRPILSTSGGGPRTFEWVSSAGLMTGEPYPWVTPMAILPGTVFLGSHSVYRADSDRSPSQMWWSKVSGDLTGGSGSISVITTTPGSRVAYVGTENGRIHRTDDVLAASVSWVNVTSNYPGGWVSDIAADPTRPQRVFVTRGAFGQSRLYRSLDGGTGWTAVGSGLPNVPANTVAIDPLSPNRVFVGTDVGVYESMNDGDSFVPFSAGLPLGLIVTDLEVDDAPHVLVAGTWGRGAYRLNLQGGGTVSLLAAAFGVLESAGQATPTIRLVTADGGTTVFPITVLYTTVNQTAIAGTDYTARSGSHSFPPGTASGTVLPVNVPIVNDGVDEDDETFRFDITSVSGAVLGTPASTTITILNDDRPEVFTSSVVVDEPDSGQVVMATFNVDLSGSSNRTVTVTFSTANRDATAGADYAALSLPLTFTPGITRIAVPVQAVGDDLDEDDEQFDVRLTGAVNATVRAGDWRGTIRDDDPTPEVFASSVSVTELDTGQNVPAVFTLGLSAPSGRPVTVSFATANRNATAGADYVAVTDSRTFTPGAIALTVPVTVLGDVLDEDDEQFSFLLTGAVNATVRPGDWTGTIVDNDPLPTLSTQDRTIIEGDAGSQALNFPLTLNTPSGRRVWVLFQTEDGTATAGRDYEAQNTPYVIEPGQVVLNVPVTVFGDRLYEPGGETFQVKLMPGPTAVLSPPGPWLGTILDNDPAPTVSVSDCTRVEGDGEANEALCAFAVTLSNPSSQPITVDYATSPNPPPGGDYQPVSGTLSFDPEATTQTVTVIINGDLEPEWNEEFLLNLTGPTNATVLDGEGVGTIIDNEKSLFRPIAPCRVLDTRGSGGPLGAGECLTFRVAGNCGVPSTAKAVAVNVTAVQQTAAGNLRLFPAALPVPGTSVLNFAAQTPRANNATVLLGTSGQVTVLADGAQAHVIVDVFGYYETAGVPVPTLGTQDVHGER